MHILNIIQYFLINIFQSFITYQDLIYLQIKQKEMEKDVPANKLYEEFPILRDRSALNAIKCKSGQNGSYVCFKSQCLNYPFMCAQKTCACKKDHEKCFKSFLQDFIDKFQSKIVDFSSLIQQSDKMIDLFVQKIVNQAAKIKKTIKEQVQAKAKAFSFTQEELQMLISLQKNNVKNLKGKDFYRICLQMDQQENHQNNSGINVKEEIKLGQEIWKNFQNKLRQGFNLIQKNIKNNKKGIYGRRGGEIGVNIYKESKIAIEAKECDNLKGFFNKKIKKAEILYRASQNQFNLKKFKDNCCGISNTLTLIETQFGKKVGGFTPLTWRLTKNRQFSRDQSNKTFIFSLTQNQKFSQINTNSGIWNHSQRGPIFGNSNGYSDLSIFQSSNNSNVSIIRFNYAFTNPKFTQRNKQNHLKFNGSPDDSCQVYLKDWQVWKITFEQ